MLAGTVRQGEIAAGWRAVTTVILRVRGPGGAAAPALRTLPVRLAFVDERTLTSVLDEELARVPAAGIAVSVTVGRTAVVRCRGDVGGVPFAPGTVCYAASVT